MGLFRKELFLLIFAFNLIFSVKGFSQGNSEAEKWPDSIIISEKKDLKVIVVEKDSQKLYFLEKQPSGDFKTLYELKCSTGKKEGDKKLEGDSKTPEGVYYVTGHYPGKYLSPVYGSRAFTLDYPNFWDKAEGRNGHNIWIHGTDKKPLPKRVTNGCVALANNDIDKLKSIVKVGETPVIITKKIDFTKKGEIEKTIGKSLLKFFKGWISSYKKGSYHEYLSFYSNTYLPDISWWPDWVKSRADLDEISVEYENLNIFKESEDVYTIWFDAMLKLDDESVELGKRKLFVEKKDNKFMIFGDLYFNKGLNIVKAASNLKNKVYFEKGINEFLNTWVTAWSGKDIKTYAKCYSADFYSDGRGRNSWVRYKDRLNKKYDYISVSIKDVKIIKNGSRVNITFYQTYESSGFKTSGIKTLVLKQEEGKWKILKEIWKKTG